MKTTMILTLTLLLTACVHGQANSPCPGLWCISVTELPGPKLCYDTEAQMLASKAQYEAKGMHATVVK